MKVLLINPATSNIYSKLNSNLPPLGLAYLASFGQKYGHQFEILDLNINKKEITEEDLKDFDVIGITADTPRYPVALKIAQKVKSFGKTVVMGGYHVTFMDKEALAHGSVDYVVRGEGEEIFTNLLNALENNQDVENIDGISFIKDGKYFRTKEAKPPQNLDELPFPARELFKLDKYHTTLNDLKSITMVTSRGCPFNCYFCSSSQFGGLKWRARSSKSIVDEIEYLHNTYKYDAFEFLDDNFTLNPKRVYEFADELEKRNIDIIWWCFSRVDTIVKNEAMIKRMAEVGLYRVFLGLESGSEDVLGDYSKNISLNQQVEAIKILKKYGVLVHGSFIIGDENETEEMIMNTVKWARKLKPRIAQFSVLTPFPGTRLYADMEKGGKLLHHNWQGFDALHPTIKMKYIKPKQLQKLTIKSYRKFFVNFERIFKKEEVNEHVSKKEKLKEKKDNIFKTMKSAIDLYMQLRNEVLKKVN